MAGLTTHLVISFVGFIIIYLFSKKWQYGLVFFIGHLIPDLISFGIPGIKIKSVNPSDIIGDSWFSYLSNFSHNPFNWIIFALAVWLVLVFLYSFKKIKKEGFLVYIFGLAILIAALSIHLIIDKLITETSYWV